MAESTTVVTLLLRAIERVNVRGATRREAGTFFDDLNRITQLTLDSAVAILAVGLTTYLVLAGDSHQSSTTAHDQSSIKGCASPKFHLAESV